MKIITFALVKYIRVHWVLISLVPVKILNIYYLKNSVLTPLGPLMVPSELTISACS